MTDDSGERRTPVLDQAVFNALEEVLAPDALTPIIVEAAEEIRDRLDAISRHLTSVEGPDEGGARELARLAHDLSGLSGQVGLAAMASAARALEEALRSGDAAQAGAALIELRAPSLDALSASARALIRE